MIKLQVISVLRSTYEGPTIGSTCPLRQDGQGVIGSWEEIELAISPTVDSNTTRLHSGSGTITIDTRDPELLGRFKVNDTVSLVLGETTLPPRQR